MTLVKKVVRDGKGQIIGSITSGFNDESSIVRDGQNNILGRTSDRFRTTRDVHGNLVSVNSANPGLLIRWKK